MSDHENMPEPVDVWLLHPEGGKRWWSICYNEPHRMWHKDGPHRIVPGMMSLDELAKYNNYIGHDVHSDLWYAYRPGQRIKYAKYKTALEAQWAATCITRNKQETKP